MHPPVVPASRQDWLSPAYCIVELWKLSAAGTITSEGDHLGKSSGARFFFFVVAHAVRDCVSVGSLHKLSLQDELMMGEC